MNFASIRATLKGQDGYYPKIDMVGILQVADAAKFDQTSGKKTQQIQVTDNAGESNKVKIYLGDNPDFNNGMTNQSLNLSVSQNPYKGKMYYAGFYNSNAQTPPQTTPPAQNLPPKGFQNQPQAPQPAQNQPKPQPQPDNRQDDFKWIQALVMANAQFCAGIIDLPAIEDLQEVFYEIIKQRKFPADMSSKSNIFGPDMPQE